MKKEKSRKSGKKLSLRDKIRLSQMIEVRPRLAHYLAYNYCSKFG